MKALKPDHLYHKFRSADDYRKDLKRRLGRLKAGEEMGFVFVRDYEFPEKDAEGFLIDKKSWKRLDETGTVVGEFSPRKGEPLIHTEDLLIIGKDFETYWKSSNMLPLEKRYKSGFLLGKSKYDGNQLVFEITEGGTLKSKPDQFVRRLDKLFRSISKGSINIKAGALNKEIPLYNASGELNLPAFPDQEDESESEEAEVLIPEMITPQQKRVFVSGKVDEIQQKAADAGILETQEYKRLMVQLRRDMSNRFIDSAVDTIEKLLLLIEEARPGIDDQD